MYVHGSVTVRGIHKNTTWANKKYCYSDVSVYFVIDC